MRRDAETSGGGCLIVVGLGINFNHLTREAEAAIRQADIVYCLAGNPVSENFVRELNANVESLDHLYADGKSRLKTYEEMIDTVLASVGSGKNVCFALYGHPGVFASPPHWAIERAKSKGYRAWMLPGISAEDCLFADLGIDPAEHGCQSFEASDFVLRERIWDPYSVLVLWQVPIVGLTTLFELGEAPPGYEQLHERLLEAYGKDHPAVLYEAASLPLCDARMDEVPLGELTPDLFNPHTTLVIRPTSRAPRVNPRFAQVIR